MRKPRRPYPLLLTLLLLTPGYAGDYQSWCLTWFTPDEHLDGTAAPHADPDHDLLNNLGEYLSGTSPHSATSFLQATLEMTEGDTATASFPLAPGIADATVTAQVSHDLLTWHDHAIPLLGSPATAFDLNGYPFIRLALQPAPGTFIDTDGDGLEDFFEASLIEGNPSDQHHTLADILPEEDFDANGTMNIDEAANAPASSGHSRPPLFDPSTVSAAIDASAPSTPTELLLHTPLR
jgi:hypothetical protein